MSSRRRSTARDESDLSELQQSCKRLLEVIKSQKDGTRQRAELFVQLPPKKHYPDYYQLIKSPIALNMIDSKIITNQYTSLEDFKEDIELMFGNAKFYNAQESLIYQDTLFLETVFNEAFQAELERKPVIPAVPALRHRGKTFEEVKEAISKSDAKTVEVALKAGLDANKLFETDILGDPFKWGLLHYAAYEGQRRIIELLLEYGADLELADEQYEGRPLAWAAYAGHLEICKMLVRRYGADIRATNIHGQRPYDLLPEDKNSHWNFLNPDYVSAHSRNESDGSVSQRRHISIDDAQTPIPKSASRRTSNSTGVSSPRPKKAKVEESSTNLPIVRKATNKLINSIGIVSNGNLLRCVLPNDVFGHAITVEGNIRTFNFRVLLTQKALGAQVLVFHNQKKCTPLVEQVNHCQDFNVTLENGFNTFDVFVTILLDRGDTESENCVVFVNRLE